jgi:hypothetical protein
MQEMREDAERLSSTITGTVQDIQASDPINGYAALCAQQLDILKRG